VRKGTMVGLRIHVSVVMLLSKNAVSGFLLGDF
jgi:hypothetical protein